MKRWHPQRQYQHGTRSLQTDARTTRSLLSPGTGTKGIYPASHMNKHATNPMPTDPDMTTMKERTMHKPLLTILLCVVLLGGCAGSPYYGSLNYQRTGQVLGGALGGVLGAQIGHGDGRTAAIIVGTLVGSAVGGAIGRTMDRVDRQRVRQAVWRNPTYTASTWRNPRTGVRYSVTPQRAYLDAARQLCRDFTIQAWIDGRIERIHGTACRQPDGRWQMQT